MVSTAVVLCGGLASLCVLTWLYGKLTAPGFDVAGKHVFITGGSSGLGLALAKIYARAGAKVSIVARDAAALARAKREIESSASCDATPHAVFTSSCDVTDFAAVERAVASANAFHARVTDHVVCNAGFFEPGLVLEQDLRVFKTSMDINFYGALHLLKAALPHMVAAPLAPGESRRRVVFVASAGSLATIVGYASYAGSKYALRGLSDTMRNELLTYGIETSIFFPGKISTPMIEKEMPTKPVAAAVLDAQSVAVTADVAARALVEGLAAGQYAITIDGVSSMLRLTANGVAPRNHTLLEVALLPLCALLQVPQRWYCDWVVTSEAAKAAKARKTL